MLDRIVESEDHRLYYQDVEGPMASGIRELMDANIIDLKHMINWIYVHKLESKPQYKIANSENSWLTDVRRDA